MKPLRRLFLLLPFAFVTGSVAFSAQDAAPGAPSYAAEPRWESVCRAARAQPLPAAAQAIASGAKAAAPPKQQGAFPVDGCDESALYYGYSGKPDYAAALTCGYRQRAFPQESAGDPFQGPGVLSMLYANGLGVPRDIPLAIRFACENTWAAPAENAYRIAHLESMRNQPAESAKPFDLCDDATSGLMEGACANVTQGLADKKRATTLATLRAKLPAAAQAMLPKLEAAEHAYEEARSRNEVDLSGTGRTAFMLEETSRLKQQFLINLQRFAAGNLPQASAAQAAAAARAEQAAVQSTQTGDSGRWEGTTVTREGIAETEAGWKALRAQWLSFAAVAYPGLDRNRITMELDRLRAHQLRQLLR